MKGFESGVYGNPPSFKYWLRQAAVYVLSLTMMKLLVLVLFAVLPVILQLGDWLLGWTYTGEGDALQVVLYVAPVRIPAKNSHSPQHYWNFPHHHEHSSILAHRFNSQGVQPGLCGTRH